MHVLKNKKILVTGHTGFKGGWASFWLNELGTKLYGVGLAEENFPSFYSGVKLSEFFVKEWINDISNESTLNEIIQETEPDFIFHFAACATVKGSIENPLNAIRTNILGTTHLLEALRKLKKEIVTVVVTTDKVYRSSSSKAHQEEDALFSSDIYGATKVCVENIVTAYRTAYLKNSKIATVRAGNVIGGGDYTPGRLIPDCVRAFEKKENLFLRNSNHIRPWQHVTDAIEGYFLLAARLFEKSQFSGAWNFGPSHKEMSVLRVVELFIEKLKEFEPQMNIKLLESKTNGEFIEDPVLKLDSNKAEKYLNYKNKFDLNKTLELAAEWYLALNREQASNKDSINKMRKITSKQIKCRND